MSTYSLKIHENCFEVSTNAVDEINDGLVFYIDNKDWLRITDDGYMFNEFELIASKLPLKNV